MYKYRQTVAFMMFLLIYLCCIPFVFSYILSFITDIFRIRFENDASLSAFILIITPMICSLFPGILYFAVTNENLKETLKINKLSVKNFLLIVLMAFLIQPAANFISLLSSFLFTNNIGGIMEYISDLPAMVFFLASAALPAIFEEFMFRGIILSGCKAIGIFKSAAVTGLFFGIMHLDPQQFAYTFIIGIFLSYLVIYSNSILSSITAHFIINGTQGFLVLFSNFLISALSESETAEININAAEIKIDSIISVGITACIFGVLFFLIFLYFIKSNKQNLSSEYTDAQPPKKIITVPFIYIIIIYISYLILTK